MIVFAASADAASMSFNVQHSAIEILASDLERFKPHGRRASDWFRLWIDGELRMTARVAWLGIVIALSLGCAAATPVAAQNNAASTEELQSQYRRVHRDYLHQLYRIRQTLVGARPNLLATFDRRNENWEKYVASECDTAVDRLYHGGTAVPNLGLRCRIAFENVRTEILKRNYAAIQH